MAVVPGNLTFAESTLLGRAEAGQTLDPHEVVKVLRKLDRARADRNNVERELSRLKGTTRWKVEP